MADNVWDGWRYHVTAGSQPPEGVGDVIYRTNSALDFPATREDWEEAGWRYYGRMQDREGTHVYAAPSGTPLPREGWRLERRNWRIGPWKLLDVSGLRVRLHGFTWYDAWKGAYVRTEKIDGYTSEVTLFILLQRFFPISVRVFLSWRYESGRDWDDVPWIERVRRWIARESED